MGRETVNERPAAPRLDNAPTSRTITKVGGKSRRLTARQGAKKMANTSGPQGDDEVATEEELKEALDLAGFDPDKILGD